MNLSREFKGVIPAAALVGGLAATVWRRRRRRAGDGSPVTNSSLPGCTHLRAARTMVKGGLDTSRTGMETFSPLEISGNVAPLDLCARHGLADLRAKAP